MNNTQTALLLTYKLTANRLGLLMENDNEVTGLDALKILSGCYNDNTFQMLFNETSNVIQHTSRFFSDQQQIRPSDSMNVPLFFAP